MNSPKNLDIHIKVLKQLRNRQKRKIQQLLESKSERKQSSDRISEISSGDSSTCERSYHLDDSIRSTKSEFRVLTKKSCLKKSSKFESLMIESDQGDANRGSYSSLRNYDMHKDIDISKLEQDEKLTVGKITYSSAPKNKSIGQSFFPPISCTVLPRIECADESLPAIQEKYKHEYLSPLSLLKGDDCRQKLSTFANKQRPKYQGHQYQHSDLNGSSDAIVKSSYNSKTKDYGICLKNDQYLSSSRSNGTNSEFTSHQLTNKNKGTIDGCSSDDEMFLRCEKIEEFSHDDCGQEAAKNTLINTQALPQIFPVVVQNKKRTELKKKINFESTTKQLDNLKKLQLKLKLKNESDLHLKCVNLTPKLLKNKSNDQSTKMSKEMKQEIQATPPSPQKIKVHNLRSLGIMKKSY